MNKYQLTSDEISTLISAMSTRQRILKTSGDYPEKDKDEVIILKLINQQRVMNESTEGNRGYDRGIRIRMD